MIKKIFLIFSASFLLILLGIFLYFHKYQNLPEFAFSLLPEARIPAKNEKMIIFAPHADDETLGLGGFMAKAIQNGAEVIVVLVTNGDGHRFSSMEEFRKIYPNSQDYIQSGYTRQEEAKKALGILGVKSENIYFLGYPDLGIKELLDKNWLTPYQSPYTKQSSSPYNNSFHQNVSYTGENLQNDILAIIQKYQPEMVVTTLPQDIHPDHRATGNFVRKAVEKLSEPKPKIAFYLIHFRHFPNPKGWHKDRLLTPPMKLIKPYEFSKISLDQKTLDLKEKAFLEYKSQLKSPFLKKLMISFLRQNELLFVPKS